MSGRDADSVRTVEKELDVAKQQIKRNRPRLHITLSKENYEWLKENVPNISVFIDRLVEAVKNGFQSSFHRIELKERKPGPGFEPGSGDLQSPA